MTKHRRGYYRVSDHALLRILERAAGVDIESFRTAVEERLERALKTAEKIGVAEYRIVADGLTYIVRHNVVVTVLGREMTATEPMSAARPAEAP